VNQAPKVIAPIAEVIPPVHADSTGSPFLTMVDQDAPSTSKSHTPTEIQSSVIPQDVGDDNLDMEVTQMGNDLLFSVPIPEPNTYKEALTQSCWIEAMQEELNEFEHLKARPIEKHVYPIKRIFRYLYGTVHLGLWYPKGVALTAFADADHAGSQDTRRKYKLADLLTKALGRERIEFLINKLGMRSFTPDMLKQLMN
nr:retrovirus-related Pol polyprotein from transposon TNT 1-94 [Tanacetum cinerariifolium]